jgi:HSP20 family protein
MMRNEESRLARRTGFLSPMEVVLRSMTPDVDFFNGERDWSPAVDVTETPDAIEVRTELPGMQRDDIEIDIAQGVLTIKGEKKEASEETSRSWHHREVRYGSFSRAFTLPADVKPEEASASYEDGVLKIRLPKEEKALHRKIQIEG